MWGDLCERRKCCCHHRRRRRRQRSRACVYLRLVFRPPLALGGTGLWVCVGGGMNPNRGAGIKLPFERHPCFLVEGPSESESTSMSSPSSSDSTPDSSPSSSSDEEDPPPLRMRETMISLRRSLNQSRRPPRSPTPPRRLGRLFSAIGFELLRFRALPISKSSWL